MTLGSIYRPAHLQPPCLGREPRLGLRHSTYDKIIITNYISKTSLYTTFHMYPSEPWPLKILMFALLVTHEIAPYS